MRDPTISEHLTLYLFGDQTFDIFPNFERLLQARDNPILESLFTKAYVAIRTQIYTLSSQDRKEYPHFAGLEDLVQLRKKGRRYVSFDMALTCLYHLGTFIVRADPIGFASNNACALGLCTGALAAAAVSCSRSILDLVCPAVDAIVAAFRIGLLVERRGNYITRLSDNTDNGKTWSIVCPRFTPEVLKQFCSESTLPVMNQPYISAFSPSSITVSGSPRTLEMLIASKAFAGFKHEFIPIHGPYHAPHLYSDEDVEEIMKRMGSDVTMARPSRFPVLSSAEPRPNRKNFAALLRAAVSDILQHPIHWNAILEGLEKYSQQSGLKLIDISSVGSMADRTIHCALSQTSLVTSLSHSRDQTAAPASSVGVAYNHTQPKLAVIGMSGRFPDAKNTEEFWDLLYQGLDVHKPVPASRWDAKTHVDPTGKSKNTSGTSFGCWLETPAEFDAAFFSISPREAPQIDPAQRLALMTAYEAIEQAGLVPDATPSTRRDRVGVFYGVTSNDWMETNSAQNIDTYFIPGGNRAFIPGRINYCFKFSGPSYAVDTACSSSLAGIHLACNALWQGDIDTAIAGGTNLLTNPDFTAGLDRGHFLSRQGNCRTFDDSADGYCRGEGVGTIIIKRLEDAIADSDPILGVISGALTNHSAESASITRPHSDAQRAIFERLLSQNAVDPYSISYVEMHGTGTQAGDAGEMASVLSVFAPPLVEANKARNGDQPLYLGSAKANIGHGEAASGVSSLIKVLLMMQKNTIVPHCGIKTRINRKFPTDLQDRNVNIAIQPTPWPRTAISQPRRAFVNNFSAAGGNTALMIEDAPLLPDLIEADDPRNLHLVAVSAKAAASLQGNLQSLLEHLRKNRDIPLGQLSYTTTARRIHHQHRAMIAGVNLEDVCKKVEMALIDNTGMTRAKTASKVIFIFTGQGAQYPGMGKDFFEHFSSFRKEIMCLDHIGRTLGFPSILPVIQSQETDIALFSPIAVQLASVSMQIALSKLWVSWNVTPVAVLGHSLGEYAALNVAGVLSEVETIYIVGTRAALLQEKCSQGSSSMLVVRGSVEEIEPILGGRGYEISCINSPLETVLSGSNECISTLIPLLDSAGLKSTLLTVPYAFHSSQIEQVMPLFESKLSGITFARPKIPVLRPIDGKIDSEGEFDPKYLVAHAREPVNMLEALQIARMHRLITDNTTLVEIGPHPAVCGMVKATLGPQVTALPSAQRFRSMWNTITAALTSLYQSGTDINWAEYHRDFHASQKVVGLPAYSWNLKDYWIQYVNDWSLRKGDPPLKASTRDTNPESTTIHRIVEEKATHQGLKLVLEANIAREDLRPLVQGHEVDGIPLCTPSVYADIALSTGTYLLEKYCQTQAEVVVDVSDMVVSKALILRANESQQLLQAHATVDWTSQSTSIIFMSFDKKQELQEHSRCVIRFTPKGLQDRLQEKVETIKTNMQTLRDGIASGMTARFNRPMVYRMIRPLARFHDDYRAIDEIVLNSDTLEALSCLSFGSVKSDGKFHTHPAIIDSLTQVCGFTMNCNDSTDLDIQVYMNHGWGSFSIFEPLDFSKTYTTYTCMEQGVNKLWHGDVIVLDGDKVVAFFGQIAIQGVPRKVLKAVLSIESGLQPKKQSKSSEVARDSFTTQSSKLDQGRHAPSSGEYTKYKLAEAIKIIAEASGIAVTELTDDTAFADVGIDSLMGLTISASLREELGLDIDFHSFVFDYPTIGDLKSHLMRTFRSPESSETSSPCISTSVLTTPPSEDYNTPSGIDFQRVLNIISEESGVPMEELTDQTEFADSGVDSLLSIVVASRLKDELGLDTANGSLFIECPTIHDLRLTLSENLSNHGRSAGKAGNNPITCDTDQTRSTRDLVTRKEKVYRYVESFSAGFSTPASCSSSPMPNGKEKVVLVTGASGSLGANLVYHLCQLSEVKTVVCLNRENKQLPSIRQQKAMRDKGIRFPEHLKAKLLVIQTDASKPMLGLQQCDYDKLTGSVTHLIHNAWPMSAKRPIEGFESQFQVLRNLIDFCGHIAARRPDAFKVAFQMVSSIGVVGCHRVGSSTNRTTVPEARVGIESVLPNGYSEAKWGCEQIIANTLQQNPHRFRAMIVRLGQIAGSRTSGYWNPMEHFGFLMKSSQTLHALPDVPGTAFWTTVNDVAATLSDLLLAERTPYPIYHIENPAGQSWKALNSVLGNTLNITNFIPFEEWVERVRVAPQRDNPAATLLEFLDNNYLRMSCGGLVLDVRHTLEHSKTLNTVGPVSEEVVRKYIRVWQEIGFLS